MKKGVKKSVDNGVEMVFVLRHEMEIEVTNGHVRIISGAFTDKAKDNGDGVDNVTWTEHGFVRHKPDWTQFIDYELYHKSIDDIGQILLADYTVITRKASSRNNRILYNRFLAVDYINRWVEDPGWDEYCKENPDTGERTLFRESAWNPAYEYLWGQTVMYCNDCTDYVSQALVAGGFQEDGIWYADYNSLAWVRVENFKEYLEDINAGIWVDKLSLQPGDLGFKYDEYYLKPWRHVVMISDINPHQYSAHTTDRHTYHYGGAAFSQHFQIVSDIKFEFLPIVLNDHTDSYPLPIGTPSPYPPPIVTPPPYPAP